MAAKEIAVKRYVVRLSADEREQLEALIRKGKSPARRLLKARILLKADVSEAGEGWSDSRIIKALDTSVSMVYRVRKQLVEEGFEAVLSRKQRATPAVARIFDGEKEAKLIALACSKPPKGRARWTLRLLERKVVELGIGGLVHGATFPSALSIAHRFDGYSWRDALCEAGFDVWGFDFLGYGYPDRYPEMSRPADANPSLCRARTQASSWRRSCSSFSGDTACPASR